MKRIVLTSACVAMLAVGCATQQTVQRASVVDFLYPKKARPLDQPGPTVMALPLRVAVVFVPDVTAGDDNSGAPRWGPPVSSTLAETDKLALMKEVALDFRQYPFVKTVEIIPTQYLQPGGGFDNLEQICTMFGTDVIVLLSSDQMQFTDEGVASLTYWTLVGAYVIPSERNTTKTMIDAAIYHLPNRKLLFRAPGFSEVKSHATPVNLSEELRRASLVGFQAAATNMVTSLQEQLALFKDRIKEEPQEYKVVAKPGYDLKAVGGIDWAVLLLIAMMGGLYLCAKPTTSRG